MKTKLTAAITAAAVAITSYATLPAYAQDNSVALEEIVVSARKRDESLMDVPVAVSAFNTEDIANRGIRSIEDVARYAPGLSFAKAFGRATDRPVIRGQGNVLAGVQFGVESGAAYFVDGIYYPGDLSSLDLAGVERVEVIRGPQAALYGRNTYSGAINFITRDIGDEMSGDVRVRYGDDADHEIYGSWRGPIGDNAGFSLAGRYYSYDGSFTNLVTGGTVGDEETTSISGRFDWSPSDDFTLTVRASNQQDRDGTRPFFLQPAASNNCMPGTRSLASWLWTGSSNNNQYYCGEVNRISDTVALNDGDASTTIQVPGIPDTPLPGFSLPFFPPGLFPGGDPYNPNNPLAFSGVDRDITLVSAKADWTLSNEWTITAQVAMRDEERKTGSDSDHSSVNYIYNAFAPPAPMTVECTFCASAQDDYSDYSAEIRFASPADRATRWLFGAFIYDQEQEISDITFAGVDPVERIEGVENFAIFASLEHDFSDAFSAALELRYFDETKDRNELDIMETFSNSFDEIAPRLTFDYRLNDNAMIYGIWAKGYKPGGVIGSDGATLVPMTTTYEQEESDNLEIGIKTTAMDGRVSVNAAAFFIDAENIQLTTPLADGGSGSLTSVVTNQGSGETVGVELDVRFAASENWTLGTTYALADSQFTAGCDEFQWTATSGGGLLLDPVACTGNDVNGNGTGSIDGNQFPLSSQHQFSAFADYRRPIGSGDREFFANINYSWEDKKPVQVHNLAWVPEATIVDLQFGFSGENYSLKVYGRNLTDEDAPSMVTRWLQDPLLSIYASGAFGSMLDPTNAGAAPGACDAGCSTNFPRAFFGDMRRGTNWGVEFNMSFGN